MRKLFLVFAIAACLAVVWFIAPSEGQGNKKVIFQSADSATYKELAPGVSQAVLWGDPDKEAAGSFVKFVPGADVGMHTHANDTWCTVIKGAYLYKDEAGEKRVAAGSFIFIPGGHKHWSGGDPKEGALFYSESSGKFDLTPVK